MSRWNRRGLTREHWLCRFISIPSALQVRLRRRFWRASSASSRARSAYAITEQEAHAIGVDAYVYFYPLVTMDLTRKQLTNVEPGKVPAGVR